MTRSTLLLLPITASLACAGGTLPPAQSAQVQAEIKAAETVRVADDPKSALHIKLAKDQYAQAEREAKNGNEEEASLILSRAAADAQLAVALSKNIEAQRKSDLAVAKLKELDAAASKGAIQ
jgi:hypothetical protein